MVRCRVYGEDKPFMKWVRENDRLPSQHADLCIAVTDVDFYVHNYMSGGSRIVQNIMLVEVKSRGENLLVSQVDTLRKVSAIQSSDEVVIGGNIVKGWGVSFVKLSGETPEDSKRIEFGRFDDSGKICFVEIDDRALTDILRFERLDLLK